MQPIRLVPAGVALASLVSVGLQAPLGAQMLSPEPLQFTTVSQLRGAEVMWSNPAALGSAGTGRLQGIALLAFSPNPGETDASFRQALVGVRGGPLAIGLRRDRFLIDPGDEVIQEGTGLTIALAMGGERFSFGGATEQYQRGFTSSRWELGGMWRAMESLNVGLAWRDIGSPVIVAQERPWQIVGGATYQLPEDWGEASVQATLERGDMEGFRGLVRVDTPLGADVLILADLDTDGGLQRFSLGLGYRMGRVRGFGVGSRNRDRTGPSANEYVIGAAGQY